ncbi:Uncharacterised protein [Mycobacterium tuberculosis]|nr:Uncharacterised protein [Mycobacterium tuberculosis]
MLLQSLIQLCAGHSRLNTDEEIIGTNLHNLIHMLKIKGNAPLQGNAISLQTRASPKGNYRNGVFVCVRKDGGHFLCRSWKDDNIGQDGSVMRFVLAVLVQHRFVGGSAIFRSDFF